MSELSGKTVLVTGATAGIGRQTALELARKGAQVVIVGRNPEKTKGVVEALKTESGNAQVEFLIADLSLMSEVRTLAKAFQERFGALHVLVNNVGAVNLTREVTKEGLELTFAMNHLGVFLLTRLLLPVLKQSAPSRVVTLSSDAHRGARMNFEDLQSEKYSSFGAYGRSKLMNILFTRELARQLEGTGVTANAVHPGMVGSDFLKKPGVFGAIGNAFVSLFGLTVEKGALTSIYLASSPEVATVTGRYFHKCREKRPTRYAEDDVAARRLWELSERLINGS